MADRTLLERVRTVSPQAVLLGGIVVGVLLVLIAFLVDVASVVGLRGGVQRQVGYVAAPNWSVVFTIFFPAFVYFALSALRSTGRALPTLERMLVDRSGNRVDDAASTMARRFRKLMTRSDRVTIVLASLALAGSLIEWFVYSFRPLFLGGPVPTGEADWAVAALNGGTAARVLNAAFSFGAFTMQGLYIGALVAFLVFVYVFSELIRQLADATTPPALVPDVDSTDARRGFQRLGRVVEEIIFACACAFLVFWMSRLQNLYLQSNAASLWEFFLGDVEIALAPFDVSRFGRALVDTGGLEFSSVMVMLGAFAVIVASIVVPLHTLRRAAVEARETARELASRRPRTFATHRTDEDLQASLDGMTVWPMSYPQLNQLIFWVAFAFLSLIFYRIGAAFVLLWMWRLVKKAFAAGETEALAVAEET